MKWMQSWGHIEKGSIVQNSLFFRKYFENVFGAVILLEKHTKEYCNSFCCAENNRILKLFLPECKARNSWRWLVYYGKGRWNYCLRWTLPSFKRWKIGMRGSIKRRRMRELPVMSGVCGETTQQENYYAQGK